MTDEPIEDPVTLLADLAAEMYLKWELQPGDVWTDLVNEQMEPEGWRAYKRFLARLHTATFHPIAPS